MSDSENPTAAPPDATGSPPADSISPQAGDPAGAPPAEGAGSTPSDAAGAAPAHPAVNEAAPAVDPPVEPAAPAQTQAFQTQPSPLLQDILAKVRQAFEDCEDKQQEAVNLRRQSRRLRASLDGISDAGRRALASDEADHLLRQACVIEERLPDLMQGVGELMVAQIKELSEQD